MSNVYTLKESPSFEKLDTNKKIEYFSDIALQALKHWRIPDDSVIELINYTENATFRVTNGSNKWIMRVHRQWYTNKNTVLSEVDLLNYLKKSIFVPVPIKNMHDSYLLCAETIFGNRIVDCFQFEVGENLDFSENVNFEEIGRIIARMHLSIQKYNKPNYYERIKWDVDTTVSDSNNFHNERYVDNEILNDEEKLVINKAVSLIESKLQVYGKNETNYGIIHSDCRFSNWLKNVDDYILLDFDDFGEGWYMYDLASVFGFNEDHPYCMNAIKRLLVGYQEIKPLFAEDLDMFSTFLLLRRIGLIGTGMFFEKYAVCGSGESMNEIEHWNQYYHKTAIAAQEYIKEKSL